MKLSVLALFVAAAAPESIYLCAGPKLTCRANWFVGGADTTSDRIRSYACKADVTRLNGMVGATPTLCTERFLPRPAAVRDGQAYRCGAADVRTETHCRPGYAPGGLVLGGKPLAAATQRQLDDA